MGQTEAKVNLATLPFLIPNFGLEVPIGDKQSFQLDVLGSFWDEQPLLDDTPFHVNQVFLEYRWYQQSDTQKWFIGPHIGFGMFTLQKPDFAIIYDYWAEKEGAEKGLIFQMMNINLGVSLFMALALATKNDSKRALVWNFLSEQG